MLYKVTIVLLPEDAEIFALSALAHNRTIEDELKLFVAGLMPTISERDKQILEAAKAMFPIGEFEAKMREYTEVEIIE